MLYIYTDPVGPRTFTEHMEQSAVRLVPVPLAGHVAHVLQPADLLLDEHPVPDGFRGRSAQCSRIRAVFRRLFEGYATSVAPVQQPQRSQPGGRPAPDQHDVVARVGQVAAQIVQRTAYGVRPEPPELARGETLSATAGTTVRAASQLTAKHLEEKCRYRCTVSPVNRTLFFWTRARRAGGQTTNSENHTLYVFYIGPFRHTPSGTGPKVGGDVQKVITFRDTSPSLYETVICRSLNVFKSLFF